jgi:hypothetical protein
MIRRVISILTSVAVVCGGAVVLKSRAADEGDRPAAVANSPAGKPPAPGTPQVPEESATIRDDPTIAPDPKQSADNNVSFPNDI